MPDPVGQYSPFSIPTGLWLIETFLQSLKSFALGRNRDYYGRTRKEYVFKITLKNVFLPIAPLMSTFHGKGRYFKITLKKSFFVHISENINILRKGIFS